MMISPSILLAVGVVSGIFLYVGLRSRKDSKARGTKRVVVDDGRCACCLAPFLVGRGVRCSDCGARSCRKACSRWDTSDNAWRCIFCHQQRSWLRRNDKWFDNFGGTASEEDRQRFFGTAKSHVLVAEYAAANSDTVQTQENREERCMAHAVQNFVEKIVDGLVESVNDTPIDKLYEDSEYDRFLEEHRPPLIAALIRLAACLRMSLTNKPPKDPPAMAHAALREIVERAVEEARKLPGLNETTDAQHPREGRADNSYEDLLATAILNKVIERYQRERVDGNSNVVHDTDPPKAKYTANESEHVPGEDVASYAFDLACNDDHGASIRQNEDLRKPMSFTMEERIEEVTTITSDEDQLGDSGALEFGCTRRVPFPEYGIDIVDHPQELPSPSSSDSSDLNRTEYPPVKTKRHAAGRTMDIISPIESWEDNWLFQRKRTSRSQPDAVAMLVPSSNAYYKALIGDRDAEDTSDLSECSSTKSDEEIEKELMEAINNVIPRTPRTSECDATNDRAESNRKGTLIRVHSGKDDTDSENFREITETEDNVPNSERFEEEKSHERPPKSTKITEGKINKNKDEKGYQNESSFAAMVRKEKGKAKEKSNNTVERGERTIATAVESSKQKEVKMQTEKSGERSVRGENVADENEEQRESEYTEHYDTAIQRHLDSLTRVEVCSAESEAADEARKITDEQLKKSENTIEELKSKRSNAEVQLPYATIDEKHVLMSENDPLSAPPRPGTIAEREHKKWENAPPIENNPYSEESIRKRCLERQYSKNSDISGFGRDYYINQSKAASGERPERATSAMSSISSRPSSSLSQQSNCAGDEHERQEEPTPKEINDDLSALQEDKDTIALWRKNNAEINPETNNFSVKSDAPDNVGDSQRVKSEKNASDKTTWKDRQRTDDILENQRKNSKNEINAKLNNQEQSVEIERKDDKERKVRKIDLKAYGFANEFSDQKTPARQQRMVNRLDLSSFGYQDGLRRARSNNQLDQSLRNDEKSNLTRHAYKEYLEPPRSLGCKSFAKSSGGLNELRELEAENVKSQLSSAKSMPNVGDDVCYYANPVYVNDTQDELTSKNLLDTAAERNAIIEDDISLLNDYDEIPSDVDRSFEDIYMRTKAQSEKADKDLQTLPSVKRLAEAFGRRQSYETRPTKIYKASVAKVDDAKNRSTTPEVQIVETPRQMHSLTARSISREFREGLRQTPGKLTSPPVSRSLLEEQPTNRTEIVRSKQESNDTAVISPGKLKSNIIFWEQMQKKT
ncbi:hypothetical protein PUN28_004430 [Cardiocondyla obscurior]|uniref:Uncharacterized protein n=1 Tax=Cardiocondyla obscurior TaxID=286306 RepID=A0AAW2GCM4_9HYME